MGSFRSTRGGRLAFCFAAAVLGGLILLPWWRNHALLRDFCDYGLVMAAVGRMEWGDRPYVDFLTPIQTLQFTLSSLAEGVWGSRYLSLTYANAVFILGSFAGLAWILAKPLGRMLALLVAGAVVAASSTQHTIIWYNAMGVTWLAAVVWLAAGRSETKRGDRVRWAMILVVLWLGGMTKLTYQAAALAFAMLFAAKGAVRRESTWSNATMRMATYAICGTVLPLVTELAYTGASLKRWVYNVVQMAGSRIDLLKMLVTPRDYWATPHDYYKPMFFPFVGAWGVALLVAVGVLVARELRREGRGRGRERWFLALSLAGAWGCGGVLLATNFEIAYLAGAVWLAMATGIVVAFAGRDGVGPGRTTKWVLAGAALSLAVPAWISAWQGARAVWAAGEMDRSHFVSTDELPMDYEYLRGMRITEAWRTSLKAFAEQKAAWTAEGIPGSAYYFINATEWMVRVIPEARHRGLPLWLFRGTTITPNEIERIDGQLRRGAAIQVIVEDRAWDVAYEGIRTILGERYEPTSAGGVLRLHRLRPMLVEDVLANPAEFAVHVESNLLSRAMRVRSGTFEVRSSGDARYLCSPASSRIDLDFAVHGLTGEMTAELLPQGAPEIPVIFRLCETEPNGGGRVLLERTLRVSAAGRSMTQRFAMNAAGRKISLEIELPPNAPTEAGWRALKIDRGDPAAGQLPFPLDRTLKPLTTDDGWGAALFRESGARPAQFASFGLDNRPGSRGGVPELFSHVAGEVWFKLDRPAKRLRGEFGVGEGMWQNPGATKGLRATVIQAGGGRFEVLHQKDLWRDREEVRQAQTFDVALPEPDAWIGLVITPLDPENSSWGHAWWRGFEAE